MSDVWFKHLSATLSENGLVAYIWDTGRDHFEWTGDMFSLFGLSESDLPRAHQDFHRLINPQYLPHRIAAFHELMGKTAVGDDVPQMKVNYKFRRANGMQVNIEETASLYTDAYGDAMVRGILRIVAEPPVAVSVTSRAPVVSTDRGSSHYGRIAVIQKIDEWQSHHIHSGEGNNSLGYLLVAGIDRLSMYNEAFGPRYTDELLEKSYHRLGQIVGQNGTVHRIDGDVFALFFPQAPHNEMAAVGKYILNNFQDRPLQGSQGPVGISVSIGGINLDISQHGDPASILVKAEMAMRHAKDQGRSCYVSYREAADRSQHNRLLLSSGDQFLNALKDNRVKLAFQPIMNADDRKASFHECLIRLIDENGKMQSAGQFFPAIEKLGLSRLVDQFALRTAMHELSLFPDLSLSVNVSPATLMNRSWLRGLVLSLRDSPSVAKRLIVEVTESAVIENPEQVTMIVRTLRDLGCRVALDDFGAGYTAFSQLKDLDLDIVKIDKSFVRGIGVETNRLFVKTLQSLADGVNVKTVAEGAETMGEADMLALDGIDYIQGYIYGFPQVERVWLPKEHTHRHILIGNLKQTSSDFDEALSEEMLSLAK